MVAGYLERSAAPVVQNKINESTSDTMLTSMYGIATMRLSPRIRPVLPALFLPLRLREDFL